MKLTYDQALCRAAALCMRSERCEKDIRTKLKTWEVEEADRVIAYLKKERFLDEERFCRFFVKDKTMFNKWGKMKVAYALRAKGISAETITNALQEIDEEESLDTLVNLLRTKVKSLKYKDAYDRRNKLVRFAAGRGFDMKQISAAIDKLRFTVNED